MTKTPPIFGYRHLPIRQQRSLLATTLAFDNLRKLLIRTGLGKLAADYELCARHQAQNVITDEEVMRLMEGIDEALLNNPDLNGAIAINVREAK